MEPRPVGARGHFIEGSCLTIRKCIAPSAAAQTAVAAFAPVSFLYADA
jgi:hypothetical protein